MCSKSVWARGTIKSVKEEINLIEIIRVLRGVESHTIDLREMTFNKKTREKICTYLSRLYVHQDLIRSGFWR